MKKILFQIKNKITKILYIRSPINVYLGQKIYQNDSGFLANFIGNYVVKRNRKIYKLSRQNAINSQSLKIRDSGFSILDFEIDNMILNKICGEFNNYTKKVDVPTDGRLEISSINNDKFYEKFSAIEGIFSKKIINILEDYYETSFTIINTHIYRTVYIPKDSTNVEPYGSTEFWHNDSSTTDSIKLFVLLSDTSKNSGPMHIIDKEETKRIVRNGFRKYREGRSFGVIENSCNVKKFTGKAGKIMIADTNLCLHRGDIPKMNTHRDMLVFYITSSYKPFRGIIKKESTREQYYGFKRLFN
tara:strand:+ start:320 stop:1222 length:903 start_codon:yes stop_codon:yes gene_type:complete